MVDKILNYRLNGIKLSVKTTLLNVFSLPLNNIINLKIESEKISIQFYDFHRLDKQHLEIRKSGIITSNTRRGMLNINEARVLFDKITLLYKHNQIKN